MRARSCGEERKQPERGELGSASRTQLQGEDFVHAGLRLLRSGNAAVGELEAVAATRIQGRSPQRT